jgi:adenine-specific DNA-methyltransferase
MVGTMNDISPLLAQDPKALGAFYTDAEVANFLVWWTVRSSTDTVIDPSFGGGVFLRSACDRLVRLGGDPSRQVYGVEIDAKVHDQITIQFQQDFGIRKQQLILGDFFALSGNTAPRIDVVVGNPPFIRYQRFFGEIRRRALLRAKEHGLKLSELSSSWLPFLIHSISLLNEGGRLGMVLPVELTHAGYAKPVLEYLAAQFSQVTFLTFQKRLFPELSEDTLLLLAEGKGADGTSRLLWHDLPHADALKELRLSDRRPLPATPLAADIADGNQRLIEYFVPQKARDLYREIKKHAATRRLGDLADVGIGYVTGANDFFHLDAAQASALKVPRQFLRPAVRRGRSLTGLLFTKNDWYDGLKTGATAFLLHIKPGQVLPAAVARYVDAGKRQGVANAYKCRMRSPWFSVPHVYRPDAFLSYMSGTIPRCVANNAGAVAPNSLHVVRIRPSIGLNGNGLAVLWQTSLSAFSAEIEGHSLGGGMLKLEPREAENVLLPMPVLSGRVISDFADELNALARRGIATEEQANRELLQRGLGLTKNDCELLGQAAMALRSRRMSRG